MTHHLETEDDIQCSSPQTVIGAGCDKGYLWSILLLRVVITRTSLVDNADILCHEI